MPDSGLVIAWVIVVVVVCLVWHAITGTPIYANGRLSDKAIMAATAIFAPITVGLMFMAIGYGLAGVASFLGGIFGG
jgi:hypothetical protein